jgi:hypothetical protein
LQVPTDVAEEMGVKPILQEEKVCYSRLLATSISTLHKQQLAVVVDGAGLSKWYRSFRLVLLL